MQRQQGIEIERLSREDYQRLITFFVATRGTCNRLRTATTLWDKKGRLVSAGYNGSLPGDPHCDDVGHLMVAGHCIRTSHGEENAIDNADNLNRLRGGVARIIGSPCYRCVRRLINNGIKEIEYLGSYPNAEGFKFVKELCARHKVKISSIEFSSSFPLILRRAINFLEGPGGPLENLIEIKLIVVDLKSGKVTDLKEGR
jgi:dCMP deaminase